MTEIEQKAEAKKGRRSHSDLWYLTMLVTSAALFLIGFAILAIRLRPVDIRVPVKLTYGGTFIQGYWWTPWLLPALSIIFFFISILFAHKTKKLSKLYRNGAIVIFLGTQIISTAIIYRLSELSAAR